MPSVSSPLWGGLQELPELGACESPRVGLGWGLCISGQPTLLTLHLQGEHTPQVSLVGHSFSSVPFNLLTWFPLCCCGKHLGSSSFKGGKVLFSSHFHLMVATAGTSKQELGVASHIPSTVTGGENARVHAVAQLISLRQPRL